MLLFVGMVDGLLEIVSSSGEEKDEDTANVKQTALLNLEILAHSFAAAHPNAFVKVRNGCFRFVLIFVAQSFFAHDSFCFRIFPGAVP